MSQDHLWKSPSLSIFIPHILIATKIIFQSPSAFQFIFFVCLFMWQQHTIFIMEILSCVLRSGSASLHHVFSPAISESYLSTWALESSGLIPPKYLLTFLYWLYVKFVNEIISILYNLDFDYSCSRTWCIFSQVQFFSCSSIMLQSLLQGDTTIFLLTFFLFMFCVSFF